MKIINEQALEIAELNESITWWQNRFNAVERENRELKDKNKYIEQLQQENKQLKENKKKTIELIRKAMVESDITGNGTLNLKELLEILGGKKKNE